MITVVRLLRQVPGREKVSNARASIRQQAAPAAVPAGRLIHPSLQPEPSAQPTFDRKWETREAAQRFGASAAAQASAPQRHVFTTVFHGTEVAGRRLQARVGRPNLAESGVLLSASQDEIDQGLCENAGVRLVSLKADDLVHRGDKPLPRRLR